jgi:Na+-driven multidrug efflux pump
VAFKVPFGIGAAGNIHIGQLLGMNKPKEAQNAYRVVLTMTGITIFITVFTVLITLNYVPRAFTNDA